MKLYSRGQLILFSLASALIVVLLALGFGLLGGGDQAPPTETATVPEPSFELDPGDAGRAVPAVVDDSRLTADERETIGVFETRNDGVVNISTQRVTVDWFFDVVPQQGQSGSGSIIDRRGYILTNNHVIEGASEITIALSDGTTLPAEVVGTDRENDLAVLKIEPDGRDLSTIPMGDSSNLRVGQKVLAIGNPFAIGRTLTTGVVSGLGRSIRSEENFIINDLIQTDASINPGNSGGPLLNSRGEMIGINTMIYSQSGGSIGIGFAVPVNTAKRVVPDLIEFGVVRRGWIEIVPVQLFPQLVRFADLPTDEGVLISQVVPGGNADAAGLRGGDRSQRIEYRNSVIFLGGDIITEVDGTPVRTLSNLFEALEDNRPGEQVTVTYVRGNRERQVAITLSERPQRVRLN
jgi:S1-C subfamily serine protease